MTPLSAAGTAARHPAFDIDMAGRPAPQPQETFELSKQPAEVQSLVEIADKGLAAKLGIDAAQVQPLSFEHVMFDNSSLGIPERGMGYADDMENGYSVHMKAGDKTYEFNARFGSNLGKYAELPADGQMCAYFAKGPNGIMVPAPAAWGPRIS
ncbi:MAG TPA: hypothetical protein VGO93_26420 [Candidatus Xenobia bacterium]|jgi:hypothetical protein